MLRSVANRVSLSSGLRGPAGVVRALATSGAPKGHVDLRQPIVTNPGNDLADASQEKITKRNQEIRKEHERTDSISIEARRKRLVWRSKQRGWLEVDLLLGTWATENVGTMTPKEMDEYEKILNLETIDIFKVVTRQMDVEEEYKSPTLTRLIKYAESSPIGHADPAAYLRAKAKMSN